MAAATLVEFGHDISGTTAQRPSNADIGCRFFDTTLNELLVYNGTAWQAATPSVGLAAEANTNITTVGAGTLTAAAIVSRLITRSGSTAAYSDATDTAAAIIAALPAAVVGQSFQLVIKNTVGFNETITAGSGVTLSGAPSLPFSILYASVTWNTYLPEVMSTWPPPKFTA